MKNLGYEFVTAEFANSAYDCVRAYWTDPENPHQEDGTPLLVETLVEVKDDDAQWKELQELISLDDLYENTYQGKKNEVKEFQETVIKIAKDQGYIYDIDQALSSNIYKAIVKALFMEFDPEEHKEQLFFLKMELFEQEFVKSVTDRALKKELRQSEDLITAVEAAIKVYRKYQETK